MLALLSVHLCEIAWRTSDEIDQKTTHTETEFWLFLLPIKIQSSLKNWGHMKLLKTRTIVAAALLLAVAGASYSFNKSEQSTDTAQLNDAAWETTVTMQLAGDGGCWFNCSSGGGGGDGDGSGGGAGGGEGGGVDGGGGIGAGGAL